MLNTCRRSNINRTPSPRVLALGAALLLGVSLALTGSARAQIGVSVSAETDDWFRGVSLSGDRPDATITLTYDHASGLYAGASLMGAEGARSGFRTLGYAADFGYAAALGGGRSWDVGLTDVRVIDQLIVPRRLGDQLGAYPLSPPAAQDSGSTIGDYRLNYEELYAGLVDGDRSLRVYVSPDYLNEHVSTVYLDLKDDIRLRTNLRLFGHVGALTPVRGRSLFGYRHEQYDARAGLAYDIKGVEIQFSWAGHAPGTDYPAGLKQRQQTVILGASYFF
jgi:hypothetical protein